jgi:hypothetical protein
VVGLDVVADGLFRVGGCGAFGGSGWGRAYAVDAGRSWTLARTIPEL